MTDFENELNEAFKKGCSTFKSMLDEIDKALEEAAQQHKKEEEN